MVKKKQMKHYSSILWMLFSALVFSQGQEIEPDFIEEIHKGVPNIVKADSMFLRYKEKKEGKPLGYYQIYEKKKGFIDYWHSEFHHWRKEHLQYVTANGDIEIPTPQEIVEAFNKEQEQRQQKQKTSYRSAEQISPEILAAPTPPLWTYLGPKNQLTRDGKTLNAQANAMAFDQSLNNRDLLYTAPENGGIYKSIDRGVTWSIANPNDDISNIQFIKIHPDDDNKVVAADTQGTVYTTIDAGATWRIATLPTHLTPVEDYGPSIISTMEILPAEGVNPAKVFILGTKGLYTYDFDTNTISPDSTFPTMGSEIKRSPTDTNTIYALGLNTTTYIEELYISTDRGQTWINKAGTGYIDVPSGETRLVNSRGGRIGLTPADPNRIYVYLIGEYKAGDPGGFITFMRSEDGGETWVVTDPNGPGEGGVNYQKNAYATAYAHVNLSAAGNGTYHQGYYNTGILVDQFDANKVIVGGVTYHKTEDGGHTWSMVSNGYIASDNKKFHSDFQIGMSNKFDTEQDNWICNDGGILYSNNFFGIINTDEIQMRSTYLPTDFWGFDVGLFHKNLTGGRYHNGDAAMASTYNGDFIYVGGSETNTGLVLFNNEEREMMWRDATDRIIPSAIGANDGQTVNNSAYYPSGFVYDKTVPMFDKSLSGTYYFGINKKVVKFNQAKQGIELKEFEHDLVCVATCATDENYIYAIMQGQDGYYYDRDAIYLQRSTDGGMNWEQVYTFPNESSNWRGFNVFVDNNNPLKVWAYSKLSTDFLMSEDGGETFNVMTSTPKGAYNMTYQWSSNNIYAATKGAVYRYDIENNTWHDYLTGIPASLVPHRIQATYGEKKLILSSEGYGVWEADFYSESNETLNYVYLNSDIITGFDASDTFTVNAGVYGDTSNKTLSWETNAENATITPLEGSNGAEIIFNDYGIYDVVYKVTDNNTGTSQKLRKKFYIYPGCSFDDNENATLIPLNDVAMWLTGDDLYLSYMTQGETSRELYTKYGYKNILSNNCSAVTFDTYNGTQHRALYFDGNSSCQLNFDKTYTEAKTIFWVLNEDGQDDAYRHLLGDSGSANFHSGNGAGRALLLQGNEFRFDSFKMNGNTIDPSATPRPNTPSVIMFRAKDTENIKFSNFSKDRSWGNRIWKGHLAELIVYNRRLTDEEIQKVEHYLMKKYHITTP